MPTHMSENAESEERIERLPEQKRPETSWIDGVYIVKTHDDERQPLRASPKISSASP